MNLKGKKINILVVMSMVPILWRCGQYSKNPIPNYEEFVQKAQSELQDPIKDRDVDQKPIEVKKEVHYVDRIVVQSPFILRLSSNIVTLRLGEKESYLLEATVFEKSGKLTPLLEVIQNKDWIKWSIENQQKKQGDWRFQINFQLTEKAKNELISRKILIDEIKIKGLGRLADGNVLFESESFLTVVIVDPKYVNHFTFYFGKKVHSDFVMGEKQEVTLNFSTPWRVHQNDLQIDFLPPQLTTEMIQKKLAVDASNWINKDSIRLESTSDEEWSLKFQVEVPENLSLNPKGTTGSLVIQLTYKPANVKKEFQLNVPIRQKNQSLASKTEKID